MSVETFAINIGPPTSQWSRCPNKISQKAISVLPEIKNILYNDSFTDSYNFNFALFFLNVIPILGCPELLYYFSVLKNLMLYFH